MMTTQRYYFYRHKQAYSGKGWAKLSSLKNHLRQRHCNIRGRGWGDRHIEGDLENANKFLATTTFYEVNPSSLQIIIFYLRLNANNEWERL